MVPASGGVADVARVAPAPLSGVTSVAQLAEGDAALEGPVAQQARHDEGEGGQTSPPRGSSVAGARARLVRAAARRLPVDAARATPVDAVIEQSLDAAEAGRVVEDRVRGAEALVVAQPLAGQRGRLAARLAPASTTEIAHDGETSRVVGPRREIVRWFLGERNRLLRHRVRGTTVRRRRDGVRRGGVRASPERLPSPRRVQTMVRGRDVGALLALVPAVDLRAIAAAFLLVQTTVLVPAVLERRLDVLVDGPLAVRSRHGETHLPYGAAGRRVVRDEASGTRLARLCGPGPGPEGARERAERRGDQASRVRGGRLRGGGTGRQRGRGMD